MSAAPEACVDALTREWERGLSERSNVNAEQRMHLSLRAPAEGGNVPKPNLFERYLRDRCSYGFGTWVECQ